ncbi:SDR family oxidoreductase [Magnetospirillum molischianum]|uniref:Dehydrogenase with different specificities n=1 Tax=Magnetospirillum molischianum DSM 120 TaxID=1150626 RepID=H8FT24_MAGML|nr:SDR family oxidoreductase [Magnetospirillum molischianum]CCG41512.1 Dehydrogenase with different specificities [Magnetospirillum molischianum DSM 120]
MITESLSPALPHVALVTGAARRIGRAIALDLARAGFAVAVHHSRSAAEAEAVVASISAQGGRAISVAADLSREDEVAALLGRVAAQLGPVGVLVNNASTFERDDALDATRESWDLHMEVNLRAPFVLTQSLAHHLPATAEAVVVNLIDQRVWNLTPHFTTYTLSKAGLWTLTRTLALALAPRIRVVAIGPGPALPSARQSEESFAAQVSSLPLNRGTGPDEICAVLRFLLSTPSITGQMIALDGGQHLGWGVGGDSFVE